MLNITINKKVKERLSKKVREKYQNTKMCLKKKILKQQYGSEKYKTLPEDKKQRLVEYRKNYYRKRKKSLQWSQHIFIVIVCYVNICLPLSKYM